MAKGELDETEGTNQQVDGLDDVEEDLILAVANAFGPPRDGVGDGHWGADLDLELVRLLGDVPGRGIIESAFPSAATGV